MPRVEHLAGRRTTALERLEHTRDRPARAREFAPGHRPAGDEQAPSPRTGPRTASIRHGAWLALLVGLSAALAWMRTVEVPTLVQQSVAGALGVLLAVGLAVRGGRDPRLYGVVGVALVGSAVGSQWDPLVAGAAIATGVVAACLAVLGTRPAATFPRVVLEVVLALGLAGAGSLGVAGFDVALDAERLAYTVLAIATVAMFALVYRLGGGLHGLGTRGLVLAAGAFVLLVVVAVYTAALTTYGSPEVVDQVQSARDQVRDTLGGVPSPVEVLVGIPALAWGVSMRSRRRQGWWVSAFGVAATATAATRLVAEDVTALSTAVAAGYSIVLGLLLGLVLIRLEQRITFSRDRRTSHAEHVATVRDEPPRMRPLH